MYCNAQLIYRQKFATLQSGRLWKLADRKDIVLESFAGRGLGFGN